MTSVRLTQIDGKLPNLALMKLAHFHRERGDDIHFSRSPYRGLFEPDYERVYGSAIFSFSADRVARFQQEFPGAIVGGTWNVLEPLTVEETIGEGDDRYDYSLYPDFNASIGFTARGCRLKCGFCVVPKKEGKPRVVNTVAGIWRGPDYPKRLHLLDNDFFGQPREEWEARIAEIRDGGFKVCFSQGINIRMVTSEVAAALGSIDYRDDKFEVKRLYTAWDNIGDEARFFRGVDLLDSAGIPPRHLMVYMLIGYDPRETWARVFHRFNRMVERDIRPYPMVFGNKHQTLPLGDLDSRIGHKPLWEFQKWVIGRYYEVIPDFANFDNNAHRLRGQTDLFNEPAA